MNCVRGMLNVLMDGITDSDMLISYKEEAEAKGERAKAAWFHDHAKERISRLKSDYDFVASEINLAERVNDGDEIAKALMDHIDEQIAKLHGKL